MIDEKELIEELRMEYECADDLSDFTCGAKRGLAQAISIIKHQPKVGEWIPCSDRLPIIQQDVLVTIKRRNISYCDLAFLGDNGRWHMSRRIGYIEGNVLAWQPLPERYEEKENG